MGTTGRRPALTRRRKAAGHTQESLAEALGIDRSTIVRWESGVTEPTPASRPKIAGVLGLTLDELDRILSESPELPSSAETPHLSAPHATRTVTNGSPPLLSHGDTSARQALRIADNLDTEKQFDPELLDQGISYAWRIISSNDAKSILAALTRHAALAAGKVDTRQRQDLALLSMAVARRQSDRRALDVDLHHPTFRSDSADSVLFQLRFRRERLMLASHHNPGRDWRHELAGMNDLLAFRRNLLPADDARHMEKVYLHLQQGIHLRQARELTAAGKPMDIVPASLTDDQIQLAVHSVDGMIASLRDSFRIADQDTDDVTLVNAHRRKTEAEGVVHLLSRVRHPDALSNARRLQRDLNRLEDVYFDEHADLRSDVAVLWLLAMADQCVRRNETEQARHYVTTALHALPEGIPHLAIRAASVAATVGDIELAKQLVKRVPQSHTWPSYVRHLAGRLHTIDSQRSDK